jgi:uncharacterized LabA/DUF88 family protein
VFLAAGVMPQRVAVFMDGANLYQAFRAAFGSARYSPAGLATVLAAGRPVVHSGFYIGAVTRQMGEDLYAHQQRFLAKLRAEQGLTVWTRTLERAGERWYEKGVDVKMATDMVAGAYTHRFDVAIVASGDSDLAPAVREVRGAGLAVEHAMTRQRRSWHLTRESSRFVEIDRAMFERCAP